MKKERQSEEERDMKREKTAEKRVELGDRERQRKRKRSRGKELQKMTGYILTIVPSIIIFFISLTI